MPCVGGQTSHCVRESVDTCFAGHILHSGEPFVAANRPRGQPGQMEYALMVPWSSGNDVFPAGHSEQLPPASGLYQPGTHDWHWGCDAFPRCGLNSKPAAHMLQLVAALLGHNPGAIASHATHSVAPRIAMNVPAGHGVHTLAPAVPANLPGGHSVHSTAVPELARPGLQSRQNRPSLPAGHAGHAVATPSSPAVPGMPRLLDPPSPPTVLTTSVMTAPSVAFARCMPLSHCSTITPPPPPPPSLPPWPPEAVIWASLPLTINLPK
mmetsp:Transcript_14835/g.51695  ORF Transcript_14835/g.51695 Transcript_14835/m.51695 type:complete len:266 (-) Transcript_14835:2324-3121(-)